MSIRKQPVFVIGYPRSGTTFLLHFLLSSGEFPAYDFDETHFFSHYYRRFGDLSSQENYQRLCNELIASDWFRDAGINGEELLDGRKNIPTSYVGIFVAIMDKLADQQGYSRWLEKTPWHILYIREIRKEIPGAKILLTRRDPRDVVLSIYNYGWAEGVLKGPVRAALAWRWHMNKATRDLASCGNDVLQIRYEDLVNDTEATSALISQFLSVDINLDRIQETSHGVLRKKNTSFETGDDNPVYRWKSCEDHVLIRRIEYALGDSLARFGYESSGLGTPVFYERLLIRAEGIAYGIVKQCRQWLFPIVRK